MTSRIGQASQDIMGMFIPFCDTVSRAMATSVNRAFSRAFNNPDKLRLALAARGFSTTETTSEALKRLLCLTEVDLWKVHGWVTTMFPKDTDLGVLPLPNAPKGKLSAMALIHHAEKTITDLKSMIAAYELDHPDASRRFEIILNNQIDHVGHRRIRIIRPIPYDDIEKQDREFAKYVRDKAQFKCLTEVRSGYQTYQSFLVRINSISIQDLMRRQLGPKAPKPKVEDAILDLPRRRVAVQRTPRREAPKAETSIRFFGMPKTLWGKLGLACSLLNTIPVLTSGIVNLNITRIFAAAMLAGTSAYAFNRLENPSGSSFIRTLAVDAFYMMTCRFERPNRS